MQISEEALKRITGVGPALATSLAERFPSWEDLHEASDESLLSTKGMRQATIDNLRAAAELEVARGSIRPAAPALEKGEVAGSSGEKMWVLQEQRIDPNTVLRSRVEASPATCLECGYDVVRRWGLRPFDELPEDEKAKVLQSLEIHRRQEHAQARVVTDSQLREMTRRSISKREAATA